MVPLNRSRTQIGDNQRQALAQVVTTQVRDDKNDDDIYPERPRGALDLFTVDNEHAGDDRRYQNKNLEETHET